VEELSIDQLYREARSAMAEQRMVMPAGNNALEYYLAILQKDATNAGAMDALRELFPFASGTAEQQIDQGNLEEATRIIDSLAKADSSNYTLTILRSKIEAKRKSIDQQAAAEAAAAAAAAVPKPPVDTALAPSTVTPVTASETTPSPTATADTAPAQPVASQPETDARCCGGSARHFARRGNRHSGCAHLSEPGRAQSRRGLGRSRIHGDRGRCRGWCQSGGLRSAANL
jgi:protein TonB